LGDSGGDDSGERGGGVLLFFLFLSLVYLSYRTCKASEKIRWSSIVGIASGLRGMGGGSTRVVGSRRPRNSPSKTEKGRERLLGYHSITANERSQDIIKFHRNANEILGVISTGTSD